ncbi:VOC family protein [Exilibacterium tricleocarpae]|uniref:VOC family protein n=1 Tax=Exilibacterium tricleocarpae TaxID=2591008 RepID=A0A545TZI7_9GAMM|nr:VOC family protein [Exilibacterium tricleocarpae]TQV82630.1 VOC family protein [Exilibacterium tricleocarpae]
MTINKPVFKRADHVSLTVADLDATIAFYTEVMGAEVNYRMGPFDAAEIPPLEDGRDWTDAHVNVKGARLEIAMLRLTDNLNMELFQYQLPKTAAKVPPKNCDVGSRHLCLEVDHIDLAIDYLVERGCRAMAGPITMEDGPCAPSKSWYILDPFGNQLELVEYI